MKKKLLLLAVLIVALSLTLFGCGVEKVGETYVETEGGYSLKRFVGTLAWERFEVPNTHNGEPVVELGWMSVSNAESLKTIVLGDNILRIDAWALSNCSKLETITVSENNPNYCSVDGVLYNKAKTELLVFPNMNQINYTVLPTTKVIGENAFYKCWNLETVVLPEGLTKISDRGFWRTTNLAPPKLPSTLETIGGDAFGFFRTEDKDEFKARNVPTVMYIPQSVKEIGRYAFCGSGITEMSMGAIEGTVTVGKGWLPIQSGSVGSSIKVKWGVQA